MWNLKNVGTLKDANLTYKEEIIKQSRTHEETNFYFRWIITAQFSNREAYLMKTSIVAAVLQKHWRISKFRVSTLPNILYFEKSLRTPISSGRPENSSRPRKSGKLASPMSPRSVHVSSRVREEQEQQLKVVPARCF